MVDWIRSDLTPLWLITKAAPDIHSGSRSFWQLGFSVTRWTWGNLLIPRGEVKWGEGIREPLRISRYFRSNESNREFHLEVKGAIPLSLILRWIECRRIDRYVLHVAIHRFVRLRSEIKVLEEAEVNQRNMKDNEWFQKILEDNERF